MEVLKCISEPIIEFKHQLVAINKALEFFSDDSNSRGKIIMPCGSGKSLTSLWILQQMTLLKNADRTIITVPNLVLQSQMFKTFYSSSLSDTHDFICIGSDKDITDGYDSDGIVITTRGDEIKSFLNNNKDKRTIVIATYQSLRTISEVCKEINYDFDFSIIDEAHRTVGGKDKCFSAILFDEEIRIRKRLFMTATEKIYSGKDNDIIAMNTFEYYGDRIHEYTLPQAIEDGVLCDYKIATVFSTSEEIDAFINSNQYLNVSELNLSEDDYKNIMCSLLATIRAIKEKGCKKIVTYHTTIKKAQIFKELLDMVISNSVLDIATFHVNGKQNYKDKSYNMEGFKKSFIGVLTNSQALVEGVDIPCIDCIVFADKKESLIGVIQAVGRALRKFNGKLESYIVIPILTQNEEDIDIENSTFCKLFNILISLSIMDERVLCEMKSMSTSSHDISNTGMLNNIISIDNRFKDKIISLIGSISLRVWDKLNSQPFLGYEECKEWFRTSELGKSIRRMSDFYKNRKLLPSFIPKEPRHYYGKRRNRDEWRGWDDFLGINRQPYLEYEAFISWIRENELTKNIKTREEWFKITKFLPSFISKTPQTKYNKSWGEILGTNNMRKGIFLDYESFLEFVKDNELTKNIKSAKEWNKIKSFLPSFIPKDAQGFYSKQGTWTGWGIVLRTNSRGSSNDFVDYKKCYNWVKENELTRSVTTIEEWKQITKFLPSFIPKSPKTYYKHEWVSWGNFLRTENRYKGDFLSYEEFKKWFSESDLTKNLKTSKEWFKITKSLPLFIPKNPPSHYGKNIWEGWNQVFGRDVVPFLNYDDFKKWFLSNDLTKNITSSKDFFKLTNKLPLFIPKNPVDVYKRTGEWKGWGDLFPFIRKNKHPKMTYEISGIHPKQYENEIAGGDTESIKTVKIKSESFSIAKKESKNKKWHEVQVRATDDFNELCSHWYFKNGKLTTDMSV